nr:MipA/OmpV family protein [Methylobacterium brachythecii]
MQVSSGSAADLSEGTRPATQDRVVSVTAFSLFGPKYLGAERYGPFGYPAVTIRRPDEPFALDSPDDSLGVPILDATQFKLGPVVNLRQGRNTSVDRRFAGLDRDPWAIEGGIFADLWVLPDQLRTRAELRHGLRGNDGFAIDLSADLFERFGAVTVSVGPRFGVLDAALAQRQFGVSPAASSRNGLFQPYRAAGGLQSMGLTSAVSYDWSPSWRTTLYGRYEHLVGDAAASPITRRLGSVDQLTAGLGVTYSFHANLPFIP